MQHEDCFSADGTSLRRGEKTTYKKANKNETIEAHSLSALVAEKPIAMAICRAVPAMFLVELKVRRLAMLPLTERVMSGIDPGYANQHWTKQRLLPYHIIDIAEKFSRLGTVAFIATQIDVELGGQACCVWQRGKPVFGPWQDIEFDEPPTDEELAESGNAGYFTGVPYRSWLDNDCRRHVNEALAYLGVDGPDNGCGDAFEQCGLYFCRDTESWAVVRQIDQIWDLPSDEAHKKFFELSRTR